jgi:hypothetical protein
MFFFNYAYTILGLGKGAVKYYYSLYLGTPNQIKLISAILVYSAYITERA